MNTLDELYEKCFIVNQNFKVKEYGDIKVVKNVFKDPNLVLNFQNLLSKWESCKTAKPGLMSLPLPYWTANYVQRQVFNFECSRKKSETEFIYFYWNNTCLEVEENILSSNNCLLPHIDSTEEEENLIFLINLNPRPIRTGFWKFKGKNFCKDEDEQNEYYSYSDKITEDNYNSMTNNGILDKDIEIEYHFNDALLYPSNRYHQPIIDKFYTRENPRIILRYSYTID
jgi:hypothetical protein